MSTKYLMGSLVSHDSRMIKYEEHSFKKAFKSQVTMLKSRGRKRIRGKGRGNKLSDNGEHNEEIESK